MIVWAILWSFPWAFNPPDAWPADLSFTPLAHYFFAQGRPWGASTLHTSGIWGFLRFPVYHPDTFLLFMGANVSIGAVIGWFFVDRARRLPRRGWVYLVAAAALIPLLSASDDARWYVPIFGLLISRGDESFRGLRSPLVWALAFCVALAAHTKGNLYIAGVVLAFALMASDALQRRVPWDVLLILVFSVILLYAGGGDLGGFARYTIHVLESTRAYPESFSQSTGLLAPTLFLLGVVCAGVARSLQVEHRWQWPLALGFGLLLFLLYKGAFVRQDAIHITRSLTAVLVVVVTETVASFSCRWTEALPRSRTQSALALSIASVVFFLAPLSDGDVRELMIRDLPNRPVRAWALLGMNGEDHAYRRDRRLAYIRAFTPGLKVNGTVATIGTFQTPVLSHGLRAQTLPVVAHYEVWSPRAAAAIDAFLAGERAPRFLVRTSSYASAANEVSVARFYRPTNVKGFYYELLERREEPLEVRSRTIFEGAVGWNEPLEIPEAYRRSLIVVDLSYHVNLVGRLIGFLFHPPHAQMVLERLDGSETHIRLNSMLADQGVVAAANIPHQEYGGHLQQKGVPGVKRIQDGHWGGASDALHLVRHRILTDVQSNVRRIELRARTLDRDASALFDPQIRARVRVLSFTEPETASSQEVDDAVQPPTP